jgi:uncharacterized protein (DUF1015 family)
MAEIRPFRAWRYNDELVKNIGELTSPLFDVASEKEKAALYSNPYNSIHLSIPGGKRPAQNASRTVCQWKAEGCLRKDPDAAIYVYYQYFKLPGDPSRHCRKGFICKIRIYEWDQNVILRHENTMPRSVDEQVALLAATRLNASPTHGLYTDEKFELEEFMDASMEHPICQAEDYLGIRDVLSVITDPAVIERFRKKMEHQQVILADGHHRYAGSLAYMKQQAEANPEHTGHENYNFHLMWLPNTDAQDLKILPTHRLISQLADFDETVIVARLAEHFTVKPVPNPDIMPEVIAGKLWTFGLIFANHACRVSLKPEVHDTMKWEFPDEVKALDLTVMHYFIIQEILGIKGRDQSTSPRISYERSFGACLTRVLQRQAQLALITNELSISEVKTVCNSGCTLPQKSTFFWPKAICGFVFSSI